MSPNPEVFAKEVLWKLSCIQGDVYQNQLLLAEMLATQTGQAATVFQEKWKEQIQTMKLDRYHEALDAAGIDRDSGQTPDRSRFS